MCNLEKRKMKINKLKIELRLSLYIEAVKWKSGKKRLREFFVQFLSNYLFFVKNKSLHSKTYNMKVTLLSVDQTR